MSQYTLRVCYHWSSKMQNPLVSVIVPCFNAEKYIDQTIQSVIAQSYVNWELILVDDCSTDQTLKKIQKYSEEDNRIRVFTTDFQSGSPSNPRNIGLSVAKGELVAFLDADDIWLTNKLQEQVLFLQTNGYEFIYSDYEKIAENGERKNRVLRMKTSVSYSIMLGCCEIPCLTVLLKRNLLNHRLFKEIGKEDYLLWLEILRSGVSAYNTCKVHALYRERSSSRSANKFLMLYQQWVILRDFEKIPILKSLYFFIIYSIKGLKKFFT